MTISITVSGNASDRFAPQWAHVSLSVMSQGSDREFVAGEVAVTHTRLSGELKELTESGAVTEWSSSTVSTYSYRPRDNDGVEQAPVQVARVDVSATFNDFDALSPAVDGWLRDSLISLGQITWSLTTSDRQAKEVVVRRDAVQDAVAKAQAYADALGAGSVEPVEIADSGMLSPGTTSGGAAMYGGPAPAAMARSAMAAHDTVELRPQDIWISVSVDARFTADR